MSLPINWQSASSPEVGRVNLLSTSLAPFTRLVDPAISTDEGNAYGALQDAWDDCSDGDSIFVKAGTQTGGLVVSSSGSNNKNNISIVCESPWSHSSGTDAAYWASQWSIEDCNGLYVCGAVVRGASGTGLVIGNCSDVTLERVVSEANDVGGFLITQTAYSDFVRCVARNNNVRGWVGYDGITENSWIACGANGNGSHGFQFSQFPTANAPSFFNKLLGCWARDNTGSGDGFNIYVGETGGTPTYGQTHMLVSACTSRGNSGDGFSVEFDGTDPFTMADCISAWNTGAGMRRAGAAALSSVVWEGNNLSGNTAGNLIGSMAGAIGYDQNGLTAPGINRL